MSPSRPRWFKMSVAAIHRVGALEAEAGMHRRLPKGLILMVLYCFSMLASQAQIPSAVPQPSPGIWACEASIEKRSEEHTSELQSRGHLVCRLLLEKKKNKY